MEVLKFTSWRATNIKKDGLPHHTWLYQCLSLVNSKSFFKTSNTQHIAYPTICRVSNNISTVTLQNSFNFIFSLHYKSGETSKKFLQMSYFLLHYFIEHSFCLVVQGNNDGDKISLRLLFLLWHLRYYAENYQAFVDYCIK